MTPIHEYLVSDLLPKDPKESRKIKVKAPQYKLVRGNMYRRSFYTPWLRCVASPQIDDIVKEVLQDNEKCKEQSVIRKVAKSNAITTKSGWPFSYWRVNILEPLPTPFEGFKFLKLAIEYSTKWVEAKPLTVINGRHVERIVWEYVVCRFRVLRTISSKEDKHFREEIFVDLYKGLKVTQSIFPIMEHMEIMNHIEIQLAQSQWMGGRSCSSTVDDRGRIKEVDKRRGNTEIASIKEAYYRSKLRRHHSERSSHSIYKNWRLRFTFAKQYRRHTCMARSSHDKRSLRMGTLQNYQCIRPLVDSNSKEYEPFLEDIMRWVTALHLNIDKQVKDLRPHMSLRLIKRIKESDLKSSKSSNMMGDYAPYVSPPPSMAYDIFLQN
nr:hypothetical protein [Tanacetum cinerariifolium]